MATSRDLIGRALPDAEGYCGLEQLPQLLC
jgi:hypothetical protein